MDVEGRLAVIESNAAGHEQRVILLERKHARHDRLLEGFTDEQGNWHDGLIQALGDIKKIARRGNWLLGLIATALVTALATAFVEQWLHVGAL